LSKALALYCLFIILTRMDKNFFLLFVMFHYIQSYFSFRVPKCSFDDCASFRRTHMSSRY
jgi:hypothetical protein